MNRTKLITNILITGVFFTLIWLKLSISRPSMSFEMILDLSIALMLLGLGEGIIITLATLPMYLFSKTADVLKINLTKNEK